MNTGVGLLHSKLPILAANEPAACPSRKMKTKILIVEDDPHILLGLEEVLKSEGYETASCNRGDEALEAVAKHQPALIVLDVMLPGASGYDICKQLRAKKICRAHPHAHRQGTGN
jgi:CheY-like chemotaxis protein